MKEYSAKGLRKSVRVNTLKMSVEDFKAKAKERKWMLEQVPWCKEAFFVDREDREKGIGRDILHQNGFFYLQESASMLPPALLQPQPGEFVFDMSAAPGSKTTQMSAMMARVTPSGAEGRHDVHGSASLTRTQASGVIVANDVQEDRLWTLKSALYRLGVTNTIVTKKVGQWFANHMTERFDRVLCDAPCTAQGTIRKDSDALRYTGKENIDAMARLQTTLLEAAIHATKVGGRIVYSTCTLTPEENEGVVLAMLNKFSTQLELVDPRTLDVAPNGFWDKAIEDSIKVQQFRFSPSSSGLPMLRLWPQTYDTGGFFCAVFHKTARTRDLRTVEHVQFQEHALSKGDLKSIGAQLEPIYGVSFLHEGDHLYQRVDQLLLATKDVASTQLPLQDYALGLPFAKRLKDGRVVLHHEIVTLRGTEATKNTATLNAEEVDALLHGKDLSCDPHLNGHLILLHDDIAIGHGLAKDGKLKNNLPRWMILR